MRRYLILLSLILLFAFLLGINFQRNVQGEEGYVGADICKGCHEEKDDSYAQSIHAKKALPNSPANKEGCESCHGPGAAHANAGGGKGVSIFAFGKKVDAKEKTSKCLSCHEDSKHLTFWNMSRHKAGGISCDNCHSIHIRDEKNLSVKMPEVCYGCHRDIKLQANKQSHHPIKEGKISCSDCHNPHGEFGAKMVKADAVNELCYKCHSEKRGPYMWEHPPVEENCLTCHAIHGSNHQKLLVNRMPMLCQSCHDGSRHPTTAYTNFDPFLGTPSTNSIKLVIRSCVNCHTNIHGSNGPANYGKYFVR